MAITTTEQARRSTSDNPDMPAWPAELAAFYAQERDRLVRFAYVLTGDVAAAEDLVQDAIVRIYRYRKRSDDEGLGPYARRTLVNLARSRFRRTRRIGALVTPSASLDSTDATSADHDRVWRALMKLSARQRACIALRFYEDMTDRQIAESLGLSLGSVKRHIQRATERLRSNLRED